MSTCNLAGCQKPHSLLHSYIAGPAFHRYDFCSEEHKLDGMYLAGLLTFAELREAINNMTQREHHENVYRLEDACVVSV
jgi:hypothetical protein